MNTTKPQIKIERKSEVLKRIPFSKATLHRKINDGTFPPSISLGANSVGFLAHEVDTIIAAIVLKKTSPSSYLNLLSKDNSCLTTMFLQLLHN